MSRRNEVHQAVELDSPAAPSSGALTERRMHEGNLALFLCAICFPAVGCSGEDPNSAQEDLCALQAEDSNRQVVECEFGIDAEPDEIVKLLEPTAHYLWQTAPQSQYTCPDDIDSTNDCVFRSYRGDPGATWFVTRRDKESHAIQYLVFRSDRTVERHDVTISETEPGKSQVQWVQTFTAPTPQAKGLNAEKLVVDATKAGDNLRKQVMASEPLEPSGEPPAQSSTISNVLEVKSTAEFAFPTQQVFPLLCPVLEYEWLDGWSCDLVYTKTGVAEDNCVFTTEDFGFTSNWVITRYEPDPGLITYHVLIPEVGLLRVLDAQVAPEPGGAQLQWKNTFTGLSEEANAFIDKVLTPEFLDAEFQYSNDAIAYYLKTGKMLMR